MEKVFFISDHILRLPSLFCILINLVILLIYMCPDMKIIKTGATIFLTGFRIRSVEDQTVGRVSMSSVEKRI